MDSIADHKLGTQRLNRKLSNMRGQRANSLTEKSELENLFIDCIEEVRKDIMKRRLKNEVQLRKRLPNTQLVDPNEAQEFEESLVKLANLSKNKIKINEFTTKDRVHLMDLFVNNESILMMMYEILFPHKAILRPDRSLQIPQMSVNSSVDLKFTTKNKMLAKTAA